MKHTSTAGKLLAVRQLFNNYPQTSGFNWTLQFSPEQAVCCGGSLCWIVVSVFTSEGWSSCCPSESLKTVTYYFSNSDFNVFYTSAFLSHIMFVFCRVLYFLCTGFCAEVCTFRIYKLL